jgi:hypothetical protein
MTGQIVPIDKIAAEDRLGACDAIHLALTFLLKEAEETNSDALINAMQVQLEYLGQELDSLREILRLSGEVPDKAADTLCACSAVRNGGRQP